MKTTTKIPKLTDLIKSKKFDYVNSDITDTLFEKPKEVSTEFDLMTIDKTTSSEDIISQMEKEGYRPANAWELLNYSWNGEDTVVALGSVGEVGGGRRVVCLFRDDSGRNLGLGWWGGDWGSDYRFLRVKCDKTKSLEPLTLNPSVTKLSTKYQIDRNTIEIDQFKHLTILNQGSQREFVFLGSTIETVEKVISILQEAVKLAKNDK